MKDIHSEIKENKFELNKAASIDYREEVFENKNQKRVVIYLMSNGCEWALKNGHGCTVCGHLAKQTRTDEVLTAQQHIEQFNESFEKIDFAEYPLLNLYNNGSFFNENEICREARRTILKRISEEKNLKMVVLETRPEFVNQDVIDEIKELIPNKVVEIAIGLELKDDYLRTICLNKGFSRNVFENAAKLITKECNLRTYVMLKPVFLNECEAIENAVETINYAFDIGASTVSLEACTIQKYTLADYLSKHGEYKTPWLWSIVEVVKRTAHRGKVLIGMFQFYPSPSMVPYNCPKCSDRVLNAIRKYNKTLDISVFDGLDCTCKSEWELEVAQKSEKFDTRVQNILDRVIEG